jgi:excisionase family DNA binding protein
MVDQIPNRRRDVLSVTEAAARLGVSAQQVRQLIRSGALEAERLGHAFLVPAGAVERRARQQSPPGRRFVPANAWGLLSIADGQGAPWLSPDDRGRMKRLLAERSLERLRPRLVDRAKVVRLRAHPSLLRRLRDDPDLMLSGVSAARELRLGLVGVGDEVDAYVGSSRFRDVMRRYRLRPSHDSNVVLRIVPPVGWASLPGRIAPAPAVALDLLDHPEPRVQQVGQALLAKAKT